MDRLKLLEIQQEHRRLELELLHEIGLHETDVFEWIETGERYLFDRIVFYESEGMSAFYVYFKNSNNAWMHILYYDEFEWNTSFNIYRKLDFTKVVTKNG